MTWWWLTPQYLTSSSLAIEAQGCLRVSLCWTRIRAPMSNLTRGVGVGAPQLPPAASFITPKTPSPSTVKPEPLCGGTPHLTHKGAAKGVLHSRLHLALIAHQLQRRLRPPTTQLGSSRQHGAAGLVVAHLHTRAAGCNNRGRHNAQSDFLSSARHIQKHSTLTWTHAHVTHVTSSHPCKNLSLNSGTPVSPG